MSANEIELNDGTAVVIRPVRTDDAPLLLAMHQRLSPDSIRFRYMLSSYTPTLAEIQRLCQIGEDQGFALVSALASSEETIVGLALYMIEDPRQSATAEFAILVEDRFQGQGLGGELFQQLSWQALTQDIHTLNAYVDTANRRMMHLIQKGDCEYIETLEKVVISGQQDENCKTMMGEAS
ncbi:MAG: GNAT family N-acetyltransferase [Proteobacteria bacterium]|nr:GNAT family N-acetyltransferase [Pseudomonadota bacterium]